MVSENEDKITQKTKVLCALASVAFFSVLLAIEAFAVAYFDWNHQGVDTVFMLIPFTYCFVRFLLVWDVRISDRACIAMRKYSILMFLTQRIPLSVLDFFFEDSIIVQNSALYFCVVLSVTLIISFVILQASKKINWIKLAY